MSEAARAASNAADAQLLRDRVTAAFGGHYLVGREIGRGGMAVVYAAEDVRLQRQVALKVLPPDLAFRSDVRERFVREAQTAARLNHPNIVSIYAVHEDAGMVCFAMALVNGESVAARLQREPRPPVEFIASVIEQTADALAYAHASGVVHRDVKPDNILLDRESGRARVTDFGIARAAESGSRLTQTGVAVGTPAFMSPEQATGEADVDGRSDLYSLGVVGYLMLAGRLPFEASTTPAMLVKHVSETPPPILSVRADAPRSLVGILERCLAKRPQDRWENAMAMRDALRRIQRDGSLRSRSAAPSGYTPAGFSKAVPRRDVVAREYADKVGHRSEDWAPRGLTEPAPAPRQLPAPGALPPMPQFPPLPASASAADEREWKAARREALREWRHSVRDQRGLVAGQPWRDDDLVERTEAAMIGRFKGNLAFSGGLILFLATINAVTSPQFPWAIFPAMGVSLGVLGQYSRLRSRGITWGRIWNDDGTARADVDASNQLPKPRRIARAAEAFKRHAKWLLGSVATAVGSFAIGAGLNLDPMVVPFVAGLIGTIASGQMLMMDYIKLRRLGVSAGDAWGEGWREIAAHSDDRPRHQQMADALARAVSPAVLQSAHGDTVRNAVDDRMTIQETASRLSDADKLMVPDVEPTADALLERIGSLASGLERLDRDIPSGALSQLDARIAAVEAEPSTAADHERRLSLLTRQRASLMELVERRDAMQRQL
ncbi:MAG: protein kinase, partial [Gemmatimonadaceae bacterium]|nr:protein kinase [Gemmatimonadaceae bacterium]